MEEWTTGSVEGCKMDALLPADRERLRRLVARKREIADDPVNRERRTAWLRHDAGTGGRPMILAEWGGIHDRQNPLDIERRLHCVGDWARGVEWGLCAEIARFEELRDDHVVEPWLSVNWNVSRSDYGVQPVVHTTQNEGQMASRNWEPPIRDLDRDFDRLHLRSFAVDRASTLAAQAHLTAAVGDLCPVQIRGAFYWTLGMTIEAIDLIGLEGLMLSMYDNPAGLHRLMSLLRDDHLAFNAWLEQEGLLSLNNANDYIGSGSEGYSRQLPQPDAQPGQPVRLRDQWALLESQETVGVGPELFEEFIFPYQLDLAQRFGRIYYGCCEPVNSRWQVLQRLPNLARVSISAWADEELMAAACGTQVVYSRKPNPAMISTAAFDEQAIRADLRRTLDVARGCRVELIMKDVHTLHEEPQRLARWVALARAACGG
jgi:hypothetical protein